MRSLYITFSEAFNALFDCHVLENELIIQECAVEFDEDYTLILFGLSKKFSLNPKQLGDKIGAYLLESGQISGFNVVKGFFNFSLSDADWLDNLKHLAQYSLDQRVKDSKIKEKVLVEYCSPNTNKPLHLGHIRNILLGWSVTQIMKSIGYHVETTQVINDRGVAICKSMLAWKKFSNGKTPESEHIKSDHFVGQYYVHFEQKFREEYKEWQTTTHAKELFAARNIIEESESIFFSGFKNNYFNEISPLGKEVRAMLLLWEKGDPETIALWKKMNNWVYSGFQHSYDKLGVNFDHYYYESQTYLLGNDLLEKGLSDHVFYKEKDGSVWINLESKGLDKKILRRSDGTSLYITQDLGTAHKRHENHQANRYIYVVADEQNYHFKVLFETLNLLGEPYAKYLYHLSYGMVDLPDGKMKSREGTVVDADDLMADVIQLARSNANERGELAVLSEEEQNKIIEQIGMAALKYFILKVNPKKRMVFDPKESVDMQGHTGPYIINAYVRIKSILRKEDADNKTYDIDIVNKGERRLIHKLSMYPEILKYSAEHLDPSHLANYLYNIAKEFHKYYHDNSILNAESESLKKFRLNLCKSISLILEHGMNSLGITMPNRM